MKEQLTILKEVSMIKLYDKGVYLVNQRKLLITEAIKLVRKLEFLVKKMQTGYHGFWDFRKP